MDSLFTEIATGFSQYKINIALSLILIGIYLFLHRLAIPKLEALVEKGLLKNDALRKSINITRLLSGVIALALVLFVWGFDFKWLLAISSGIIALTGVALFASWSILSNITAFFILLMHQSYKRGNFIRIVETDNYIEGVIAEINIFNTLLISDNREYIIYPNNLLIARPVVVNPKIHYSSIGKIQEFSSNINDINETRPQS
ncbi:mechanosensitive ion channel domain-containing protein [Pseudomonadota bacterium]